MMIRDIKAEIADMERIGWKYVRTDRNGSRIYSTCKCPKCGGKGYIPGYEYIEGGICFLCDGSGQSSERTQKIMTPEYAAKLEEKRAAKARAKAVENNKAMFEKQGFNEEGKTYVVLGNTYEIKEDLKSMGAKYSNLIGWHFSEDTDKYPTLEVSVDDVFVKDEYGQYLVSLYFVEGCNAKEMIKAANDELKRSNSKSHHIGSVGEKLEMELTLKRINCFETHYTYYGETNYIYNFVDSEGNIIIWKTSKCLDIEKNQTLTLKGTVKAHSEYNGEPQTVLTRCKVC